MRDGTRFLFRDTTPLDALAEARELGAGLDVRLGGGVRTVREFVDADLVDEVSCTSSARVDAPEPGDG